MRSTGGPCDHCGTRQTPCWRKGPPESPILCNACGARWIVKKSLVGYLPGLGAHSPKATMLYTTKQPRGTKRRPRTSTHRVPHEQRPSQQRRGPGKRSQELSPAAQATFAQLKILTQLEHSVVRLAAVQPPLFQPPPGQQVQLQPPASLQVLLQRSGSQHAGLGCPAPQLAVLPGINIEVKTLMPVKASSFLEASISLRRRQRKCGSPARAAT